MLKIVRVLFLLLFISCAHTDNNPYDDNSQLEIVSVAYLRSLYSGSVSVIESNIAIETTLVSSDAEGNFYHSLVFADDTGGIEIAVDMDDSFKSFSYFQDYTIYCKGLYLGANGNDVKLGSYTGFYYVSDIDESLLQSYIVSSVDTNLPYSIDKLTMAEITDRHMSCLVMLSGVSLRDEVLSDGNGNMMNLRISDYAKFSVSDSVDNCTIMGVVSKSEGMYNITPTSNSDIIY